MGSEQIANLQRSGYLLLCFIPYMILSLYPFVQNLRYSWRTSAGICALWAAAETAAAFILLQLEGWTWAAAFHWILGIPFVLLLVARHEGQVLFAQFFLYSQLAPLPYLLNWVSAAGAGGRRGLWYAGLFAFTALYLAVIGLSYSRLIVPMLSSGLSRVLRSWSLFWMAPYAVFIVIAFGCYFLEQAGETAFLILYITLLNLLFAFIYLILKSVLLESKEALQAEMEAKNMGILVRQYEEVMERQESMRRFRHDQRHFLRTVNGLLYEENLEGLKRLICQYGEMLDEILPQQMASICANPVINGTASYYIGQARAEGVEVSIDCAFDGTDKIQDVQLSGILGNLLENALEACRRMKGERRFIRLVLKSQGSGILVLVVENSYDGTVRTRGSRFLSSKRADLGLGLASVCDAVEQTGGTVEIHYDGSVFQVRVMLA